MIGYQYVFWVFLQNLFFILVFMRKLYFGFFGLYRKFGFGGRKFRDLYNNENYGGRKFRLRDNFINEDYGDKKFRLRDIFNSEDYGERKFRLRDIFDNEDNGEKSYKKRYYNYFKGDFEDVLYQIYNDLRMELVVNKYI